MVVARGRRGRGVGGCSGERGEDLFFMEWNGCRQSVLGGARIAPTCGPDCKVSGGENAAGKRRWACPAGGAAFYGVESRRRKKRAGASRGPVRVRGWAVAGKVGALPGTSQSDQVWKSVVVSTSAERLAGWSKMRVNAARAALASGR